MKPMVITGDWQSLFLFRLDVQLSFNVLSMIRNPISDLQDRTRRRSGMDSRLRFDDSHRENDRAERDGGRYARGDRSQSRDGPDDQMFDTFRGQGSNAPFVAEFPPPPILMPVPGAG
jgi:hypothetical protein